MPITDPIVLLPDDLNGQLKVYDLADFLALELPLRDLILSPWLPDAGLCMIHAYRGVGKTHVALGIGYAVASGGTYLQWQAPKARNVLYIDGEMPAATLQHRLARIVAMNGNSTINGKFKIITPDKQPFGMPDLATPEGQAIISHYITDEIDLIILDNLSCLVRSGKENESSDWEPIQTWLLALRAKGKTVLMIHHSGKSGLQRGASKREDVLDTVISLARPSDYVANEGARFIVKYEKARGFYGDDALAFEARLCCDGNEKPCWEIQSLEESTLQKVVSMYNEGIKQCEIAKAVGINPSNVSRHVGNARQKGLITEATNARK